MCRNATLFQAFRWGTCWTCDMSPTVMLKWEILKLDIRYIYICMYVRINLKAEGMSNRGVQEPRRHESRIQESQERRGGWLITARLPRVDVRFLPSFWRVRRSESEGLSTWHRLPLLSLVSKVDHFLFTCAWKLDFRRYTCDLPARTWDERKSPPNSTNR